MFARFRGNAKRERERKEREAAETKKRIGGYAVPEYLQKKISARSIEILRRNFQYFDADQSGFINLEELGTLLQAVGQNPTQERVRELLAEADNDNSGTLSFPEFLNLWYSTLKDIEVESALIAKAFNFFDKDGNGELSLSEFREVMTELGDTLSDEECNTFFEMVDENGDGVLQYSEFLEFLQRERVESEMALPSVFEGVPKPFNPENERQDPRTVTVPRETQTLTDLVMKDVEASGSEAETSTAAMQVEPPGKPDEDSTV